MRRWMVLGPVVVLALAAGGCADAGGDAASSNTAVAPGPASPPPEGGVVVDVNATYALGPGEEQSQEQLDRSCDAASTLFSDYATIFTNPIVLPPDELRRQVLGLGQLAMEVHEFAPFDQQDEVTALTKLSIDLDQKLQSYNYVWADMEAADGMFVEMLRRDGVDTHLISLVSWVVTACPEGTVPIGG